MSRLVRLYASDILKPYTTRTVDNFSHLSTDKKDQLADENKGVGKDTWAHRSAMEEDDDPKPFYTALCNFYIATLKMLKKFHFGDPMYKNLGVINPSQVYTYSFDTIKSLLTQFPQLVLTNEALDQLREEFMDFTLLTGDHPSVKMYNSLTGDKPRSGVFWNEVGQLTTLDGQPQCPFLEN